MIIGRFQRKADDTFTGFINTFTISKRVRIVPTDERANADAPDYRVLSRGCEYGAAWDAQTNETPPRPYLSIVLDSPELPTPVRVALFEGENDHYLIWRRRKERGDGTQQVRGVA